MRKHSVDTRLASLVISLVVAVSFIMTPVALGYTIYYSLFNFNFYRAVVGCIMLFIMPHVNKEVQGER